jgi:hypothetical protein
MWPKTKHRDFGNFIQKLRKKLPIRGATPNWKKEKASRPDMRHSRRHFMDGSSKRSVRDELPNESLSRLRHRRVTEPPGKISYLAVGRPRVLPQPRRMSHAKPRDPSVCM